MRLSEIVKYCSYKVFIPIFKLTYRYFPLLFHYYSKYNVVHSNKEYAIKMLHFIQRKRENGCSYLTRED
jgi:hypothetical protein